MSRLFYVAGDPELAKRTLRLYVQIVSKAREARMAEAGTATEDTVGAFGAGKDIDLDHNWVQTLVQGSRMLSRLALMETDAGKAGEQAKEAGETLEKAKTRLDRNDRVLLASVELAEAIWHIATAYTGNQPIVFGVLDDLLTTMQSRTLSHEHNTSNNPLACSRLLSRITRPRRPTTI